MRLPFVAQRPWLLVQGIRTNRDRPDLDRLAVLDDPERFVWAMLPHAARSFATSILMLPAAQARAAAVGYLYCRMLDTYEDLSEPGEASAALSAFADLSEPPPAPSVWRDDRDRAHLLLVERCSLVDRVFEELPADDRVRISGLVRAMAEGMIWSTELFAVQGGVLIDGEQVSRYCHHVIGEPALFTLLTVGDDALTTRQRRDALASSELIQLANITRDIERDLERGVGYHPSLRPHLGSRMAEEPVRLARRRLMAQALPNVSAYCRLAEERDGGRFSPARAAAVVMLLYTDRHYRWCADRVGLPSWSGPRRTTTILLASLPAAVSRRWAGRVMHRVERDFLATAAVLT